MGVISVRLGPKMLLSIVIQAVYRDVSLCLILPLALAKLAPMDSLIYQVHDNPSLPPYLEQGNVSCDSPVPVNAHAYWIALSLVPLVRHSRPIVSAGKDRWSSGLRSSLLASQFKREQATHLCRLFLVVSSPASAWVHCQVCLYITTPDLQAQCAIKVSCRYTMVKRHPRR